MAHNRLTSLPTALQFLTRLASFDTSHNQLRTLPRQLLHFPQLHTLDLSGNPITELPEGRGCWRALRTCFVDASSLARWPAVCWR